MNFYINCECCGTAFDVLLSCPNCCVNCGLQPRFIDSVLCKKCHIDETKRINAFYENEDDDN